MREQYAIIATSLSMPKGITNTLRAVLLRPEYLGEAIMKEIEMTQGKVAIVDDDDFEYLSQWKWYVNYNQRGLPYAMRGAKPKVRMHRIVSKTPLGLFTDHINGDTLDNRKSNLRIVTSAENSMNRKPYKSNKFGLKGISISEGKYIHARIKLDGKNIHLGTFDTIEEAAAAYNKAALELFGEFARINL